MLKINEIILILGLSKKGWSDNRISKELGVSRVTIRKYRKIFEGYEDIIQNIKSFDELRTFEKDHGLSPIYDLTNSRPRKLTKELDERLNDLIFEEINKPGFKGNFNCAEIHRQLIAEGFDISYTTVRRILKYKLLE